MPQHCLIYSTAFPLGPVANNSKYDHVWTKAEESSCGTSPRKTVKVRTHREGPARWSFFLPDLAKAQGDIDGAIANFKRIVPRPWPYQLRRYIKNKLDRILSGDLCCPPSGFQAGPLRFLTSWLKRLQLTSPKDTSSLVGKVFIMIILGR